MDVQLTRPPALRRALATAASLLALQHDPQVAHAQPPTTDPALAHDLFDQGRTFMDHGDYDRACSRFEESRRLDPVGGGGTLLNLALCEEKRGRTGTAWALFRAARSLAVRDRRQDRQQFADQHIASLSPRLPRLRVMVPPAAALPALVVLRNGIPLPASEWAEPLVVDPGIQTVEARAPGHIDDRVVVNVRAGEDTVTVSVPALKAARHATEPAPSSVRARTPTVAEVFVGGAGLTAVAIAGAFGLRGIKRSHEADDLCPNYDRCDPQGIALSADAARDGRVSVATFAGGAALLSVVVVVYFVTRRSPARAPTATVGATPYSLSVHF